MKKSTEFKISLTMIGIIAVFFVLLIFQTALGAPTVNYQKDLFPIEDDTYYLGTTTKRWKAPQFTGTTTVQNLYATGNLQIDGNFFAPATIVSSGNATINGDLTVTGNTSLQNASTTQLTVSNQSWFNTADFSGDVTGISLNEIEDLTANKVFTLANKTLTWRFTNPAGGIFTEWTGNATGHLWELNQNTGNPGAGTHLAHIQATDNDILLLHLVHEGTPTPGYFSIDSTDDASSAGDIFFVSSNKNIGIGTTSPFAKLSVTNSTASTIAQIIRGASSQSANLTEWQDSDGTVLAKMSASGDYEMSKTLATANSNQDGIKIRTDYTGYEGASYSEITIGKYYGGFRVDIVDPNDDFTQSFTLTNDGGSAAAKLIHYNTWGYNADVLQLLQYSNDELISGSASGITTSNLMTFSQGTSAFSGDGINFNFGASTGSFTGNFLDFNVNSVNKFYVDSAGSIYSAKNVGLGTAPVSTHKLIIDDDGSETDLVELIGNSTEGVNLLKLKNTNTFSYDIAGYDAENGFKWGIRNNSTMGIGTAPSVNQVLTLYDFGHTTNPMLELRPNGLNDDGAIRIAHGYDEDYWTFGYDISDNSKFKFDYGSTLGSNTALTIDTSKNVGIGTTTPQSKLDVFSTATTTVTWDSNSATQGACIKIKDMDGGGYTYLTTLNGVGTFSATSCE